MISLKSQISDKALTNDMSRVKNRNRQTRAWYDNMVKESPFAVILLFSSGIFHPLFNVLVSVENVISAKNKYWKNG